jgi:hypothetical protein
MQFHNTTEKIKNVKEAHIYLLENVIFGRTESLKNLSHSITPDESAMVITAIPETTKVSVSSAVNKSGPYYKNKITLIGTDSTKEFNNQLKIHLHEKVVLALVLHDERVFIYNNSDEPLTFSYKELNPTKPDGDFGFEITLNGDTTNERKEMTLSDFNFKPFLGLDLASDL